MTHPLPDSLLDEVHGLTLVCLSGEADPEDVKYLNELLVSNETARHIYAHAIRDSFALRRWADSTELHSGKNPDGCESDTAFLRLATACEELTGVAPSGSISVNEPRDATPPVFPFLPTTIHSPFSYLPESWPVAYLIATVIFAIGGLIGAFTYVSHPVQVAERLPMVTRDHVATEPQMEFVGRVTGMVDCKWTDSSKAPVSGHVAMDQKFALASGLMEITYDTGAEIILQGPMTYQIDSKNGGLLSIGKLTGKVEAEEAKGFAVRTPTATVTDLGTEFGVEVDKRGVTTSRVYRGLVRVNILADSGESEDAGQLLRENESVRVDRRSQRPMVVVPASKSVDFVREIPRPKMPKMKTFDLVGVVAGGDGFSGHRNASIDPTSGRRSTEVFIQKLHTGESPQFLVRSDDVWAIGDKKFHSAEELPFVDGVFIPDGSDGPVTVDSAGHTFADCPKTLNFAPFLVWAGGDIPLSGFPTTMKGVDYARSGHGLLHMHANLGLTFDLDAIRKANPGWTLRRFLAMVANLEVLSKAGINRSKGADYWVLVDGRVRFRRRQITAYNGATPISILINSSDRFLTLVSADGGNDLNRDHIAFGDPRLELIEEKDRQTSLKSTAKGGQ